MRIAPPVCHAFWTQEDWDRYFKNQNQNQNEPVALECCGMMMLAEENKDENGNRLYSVAREESNEFGEKQFLMHWA